MGNNNDNFEDLALGDDGNFDTKRVMVNETNVIKVCTLIISGMTCANC